MSSKYATLYNVGKNRLTTKQQDEQLNATQLDQTTPENVDIPPVITPQVKLRTNEQKASIINSNSICVVDMFADWCEPCKIIEPEYAKLANKYNQPGVCILVSENIEDKLAVHRGTPDVTGIPTFLVYVNGECQTQHTIVGADLDNLEILIKQLRGFE